MVAHLVYINEIHDLRALGMEAPIWHTRKTAEEMGKWVGDNYNKVKEAYMREHGGDRLVIWTHYWQNVLMINNLFFFPSPTSRATSAAGKNSRRPSTASPSRGGRGGTGQGSRSSWRVGHFRRP